MANVPSIPPLLSSTPPPIDFGEEDDSGLPPTHTLVDDDEFGDYALAADVNDDVTNDDVSSLPRTPIQHELSSSTTSGFTDIPPSLDDHCIILTTKNTNLTCSSLPDKDAKSEVANIEHAAVPTATYTIPIETFNFDVGIKATSTLLNATRMLAVDVDSSTKDLDETTIEEIGKDEENDVVELNFDCCNSASLPSLKLDSLCLNNSGNQSPTSTPLSLSLASDDVEKFSDGDDDNELSKTAQANSIISDNKSDENETKESSKKNAASKDCNLEKPYSSIVVMEDIVDDSSDDERHSMKKCTNLIMDENSKDFFAIHTVGYESNKNASHQKNNLTPTHVANEDNDVTCLKRATDKIIADTKETKSIMESSKALDDSQLEFDADFSHFQNFSSANYSIEAQQTAPIDIGNIVKQPEIDVIEEDDFDDFQDFSAAPDKIILQNQTAVSAKVSIESAEDLTEGNSNTNDNNIDANDDDDDDFGDFAEASISTQVPTVNAAIMQSSLLSGAAPLSNSNQLLTLNWSNLNERLKPLLDMMFPQINECDNRNDEHCAEESLCSQLQLGSIDSAKALEYQWINSEMRHSLIKSLGIDSRNILFGEKWNSSMPRFAANLSFNPLQPVKSQSMASSGSIFSAGGTHSSMHQVSYNDTNATSQPPLATTSLAAPKADVPAVEFDWNSSGLVNPLDGSAKEDTANTGEVEAIYTSQSGESNASDAAQQQQKSFPIDGGSCNTGGGQDINASVDDSAAATSGVTIAEATATIPADVSTDSIGNHADLKSNIAEATGGNSNNNLTTTATIESAPPLTKEDTTFGIGSNYSPSYSTTHVTIDNDDDDEVVTTSTYAGPLKETHIYTPPKGESSMAKTIRAGDSAPVVAGLATTKTVPIDFDYEIAAAGIIINETVVKKEYRDVEYNPRFGLAFCNRSNKAPDLLEEAPSTAIVTVLENVGTSPDDTRAAYDDDFSDFQSVPPTTTLSTSAEISLAVPSAAIPITVTKTKDAIATAKSRTCSPTIADKMILSPAILLPQAIALESNNLVVKPKIEWGNSAASINPEELARIEQLFPQPKATVKSKDVTPQSGSPTSTPTHNGSGGTGGHSSYQQNSLSISATIAQKEQQSSSAVNSSNDDEYWSDFVSVSVGTTSNSNNNSNRTMVTPKLLNNNNLFQVSHGSPQHRQQELSSPARKTDRVGEMSTGKNSNEDEWSDFVSSAPPTAHAQATTASQFRAAPTSSLNMPQFNSAAWQNANFYNNPMSFYHQSHTNVSPNNFIRNDNSGNSNNHNNNNNQYLNNYQQRLQEQQQQLQLQQQIHVMQDFSTAVPPQAPYRPNASTHHSNQFPIGSAKVSPSISLIPDLGFVAPAMPAHTAFINALPKSNFSTKK